MKKKSLVGSTPENRVKPQKNEGNITNTSLTRVFLNLRALIFQEHIPRGNLCHIYRHVFWSVLQFHSTYLGLFWFVNHQWALMYDLKKSLYLDNRLQ